MTELEIFLFSSLKKSCQRIHTYLSCTMWKRTICICENKDAAQLRGNREQISAFVFATRIVQSLFLLNLKFQASSCLLCLYSPVCIGPVQKPHCWFSHEVAYFSVFVRVKKFCPSPAYPGLTQQQGVEKVMRRPYLMMMMRNLMW